MNKHVAHFILSLFLSLFCAEISAQVLNDSVPLLIPKKKGSKYGYVNQTGKMKIAAEYTLAGFFSEDCNILNSPNEKLRKFGTKDYATVSKATLDYRIDKLGKKVYQLKREDLGTCAAAFRKQLFNAYVLQGFYGIIEDAIFKDYSNYRQFKIYPQYQYLNILEGGDPKNPMVIAAQNDLFGIIDVNNNIIIPFIYADIKRNYSWKEARLFEVTKDNNNYFYIDQNNKKY